MAKQLTIDEMLAILHELKHPQIGLLTEQAHSLGGAIADAVAETLDLDFHGPSYQHDGTFAAFWPRLPEQPMPKVLEPFDPQADWCPRSMLS